MKLTVEFFCLVLLLVLLLSTFHGHETTNETTLMILNQQWVPNCDTLLSLIKTYREGRGIPVTIERNLIIRMASPNRPPQDVDFANLSIMQKVEVFEHVLAGEFWLVPLSCLFLSLHSSSPLPCGLFPPV